MPRSVFSLGRIQPRIYRHVDSAVGRIVPESEFCKIEYQYGNTIAYVVVDCVLAHSRFRPHRVLVRENYADGGDIIVGDGNKKRHFEELTPEQKQAKDATESKL